MELYDKILEAENELSENKRRLESVLKDKEFDSNPLNHWDLKGRRSSLYKATIATVIIPSIWFGLMYLLGENLKDILSYFKYNGVFIYNVLLISIYVSPIALIDWVRPENYQINNLEKYKDIKSILISLMKKKDVLLTLMFQVTPFCVLILLLFSDSQHSLISNETFSKIALAVFFFLIVLYVILTMVFGKSAYTQEEYDIKTKEVIEEANKEYEKKEYYLMKHKNETVKELFSFLLSNNIDIQEFKEQINKNNIENLQEHIPFLEKSLNSKKWLYEVNPENIELEEV